MHAHTNTELVANDALRKSVTGYSQSGAWTKARGGGSPLIFVCGCGAPMTLTSRKVLAKHSTGYEVLKKCSNGYGPNSLKEAKHQYHQDLVIITRDRKYYVGFLKGILLYPHRSP